jgi:ERF superfamily protein
MTDIKKSIAEVLWTIQQEVKIPKDKVNNFTKWPFRQAEDILVKVKEYLPEGAFVTLTDAVVLIGNRYFMMSEASLHFNGGIVTASGCAEIPTSEPGKQLPQISGSCSTYARKIALCGLFAVDSSKPQENLDQSEPLDYADPDHADTRNHSLSDQKQVGLSPGEIKLLSSLIASTNSDVQKLIDYYKVKSLLELNKDQYDHACMQLKAKTKQEYKPEDYLRA